MARPTAILLAVAAGAVTSGSAVAVAGPDGGTGEPAGARPPAVVCASPHGVAPEVGAAPGSTVVTFRVPARTLVRVDRDGTPLAAATDTRCAPTAADDVVLVDDTGRVRTDLPVPDVGVGWTGDWTDPGVWHAWPAG